jgi:2-polyprenyl-6-methoxyphenol hydroxylase-like FAD-dependent oxidoreductase
MDDDNATSFRIVIVGGGISGLLSAIGLQQDPHQVINLENSPSLQMIGGSLVIVDARTEISQRLKPAANYML